MHVAARLHAFYHGLFASKPQAEAWAAFEKVKVGLANAELDEQQGRLRLAVDVVWDILDRIDRDVTTKQRNELQTFTLRLFDFEGMLQLPAFDWDAKHSISDYWELLEKLKDQQLWLGDFDKTRHLIALALWKVFRAFLDAMPKPPRDDGKAIVVPTQLIHALSDLPGVVEDMNGWFFADELRELKLFERTRQRLEANLIAASGGNPTDPQGFNRPPKLPRKSDIQNPGELISTYSGGTPLMGLLDQKLDFAISEDIRFEHHHIVAGSGHGKTQTLQYLISEDLKAVAEGERSVIVIDSQGDLIHKISHLKLFAPGEPLHDRLVLIDPTDVEWPVSLNLFDVGQARLESYSTLDRERLTNSILELYDFVLGSLLSAEMTQKQNVIFRYVTRLMLHIPDATIHTLRELMEPKSELKFASHIETLTGSAREFFRTEFAGSEFTQTRKQVLRRLWGILENQTFERMFSHPRSKLDLFAEMNAGKVILINTAKDLLKEQGTEIFGRFFIAMIAQAAQERATQREKDRMPTMVYVDEAADYFDRNVGIILSQARKYKVGMVLAHQYLGQLDPKLQEAISANTSIKFAGGVSAKDARALAPMMAATPELIEQQTKGSFAAYLRGITKSAVPLAFTFGHLEDMGQMSGDEFASLRSTNRERYAVHYSELATPGQQTQSKEQAKPKPESDGAVESTPPENQTSKKFTRDDGLSDDW